MTLGKTMKTNLFLCLILMMIAGRISADPFGITVTPTTVNNGDTVTYAVTIAGAVGDELNVVVGPLVDPVNVMFSDVMGLSGQPVFDAVSNTVVVNNIQLTQISASFKITYQKSCTGATNVMERIHISGTVGSTAGSNFSGIITFNNLTISVIPSEAILCPGSPVTLCAQVTSNLSSDTSNLNFSWMGLNIITPLTTPCITVNSPGMYTVKVTNVNETSPCLGTATVSAAVAPTTITVIPTPNPVCTGQRVTLTAMADGNPAPTFTWSDQNGILGEGSTITLPCVPANETISVAAANCAGMVTKAVDLTVTPLPDSTIQVDVCSGNPITLEAPAATPPGTHYCWTNGSGSTGISDNPLKVDPTNPDNPYTLIVGGDCCTTTDPVACCGMVSTPPCCSTSKVNLHAMDCPNVCITKCGPKHITPNEEFKYVIRLVNSGTEAATGLTVTDTLPKCVKFKCAKAEGWTVTATEDPVTGITTVTATQNEPIEPCRSSKITLKVKAVDCQGKLKNEATVMGDSIESRTSSPITTIVHNIL